MTALPKDPIVRIVECLQVTCGVGSLCFGGDIAGKMPYIQYGIDLGPVAEQCSCASHACSNGDDLDARGKASPIIEESIRYLCNKGYDAGKINDFEPVVKAKPKQKLASKILSRNIAANSMFIDFHNLSGIKVFLPDIPMLGSELCARMPEKCLFQRISQNLDGRTATLLTTYGVFLASLGDKNAHPGEAIYAEVKSGSEDMENPFGAALLPRIFNFFGTHF